VYAERLIENFAGFSESTRSIGHGLFDADDLTALRALAEAMTGAIHFRPLVQASPRWSIEAFSYRQFPTSRASWLALWKTKLAHYPSIDWWFFS
jgi:hypothetical protein